MQLDRAGKACAVRSMMGKRDAPKTSHIGSPLRRAGQHLDGQVFGPVVTRGLIFSVMIGFTVMLRTHGQTANHSWRK